MIGKKVKIINWLNFVLALVALILECMPKGVVYTCAIGPNQYVITGHWLYFGNPLNPLGLITLSIAIFTIVNLVLFVVMLKKDKLALSLVALTVSILALIDNCLIVFPVSQFTTAYNIIIFIISILNIILLIAKLWIMESTKSKLGIEQSN